MLRDLTERGLRLTSASGALHKSDVAASGVLVSMQSGSRATAPAQAQTVATARRGMKMVLGGLLSGSDLTVG